MARTVSVNIRLDKNDKKNMEQVEDLGLSREDAFTIFARKVGKERHIPAPVAAESRWGIRLQG